MKIAIKGHKSRGKEVIQILESLGGQNIHGYWGHSGDSIYYYINKHCKIIYDSIHFLSLYNYKLFTLEEFEKEFPFKIGDEVTIIGLPDFPKVITQMVWDCGEILYSFEGLNNTWFGAKSLKKFEMKEERNITLTLDKAKEWYNKGGELKEIALQAFTDKELNPLPRSWEEFCKQGNPVASWRYNIPIKYETLFKLEQLRDCWRQGWKPAKHNTGYCIIKYPEEYLIMAFNFISFLSFPTKEMAKEFLECFRDLIEKAGGLI